MNAIRTAFAFSRTRNLASRTSSVLTVLAVCWAISSTSASGIAVGGEQPAGRVEPATTSQPVTEELEGAAVHPNPAEEEQRREAAASALVILLAGVGVLGIALIAGTLIWGAKVRRLARASDRGCTPVDELWYLKKPVSDSEPDPRGTPDTGPPSPPKSAQDAPS